MDNELSNQPELNVGEIISNGIQIGLKNFVPLLLTYILFVITFWIPYLNIGTFIGMQDLVPKMSRNESISPTAIFDSKYRQNIGEFFLLAGLFYAGILFGYVFMIVGAFVVGMSWMLAMPLFVDRGVGPIEALRMSNRLTYGNKANIFLAIIGFEIAIAAVYLILMMINKTLAGIVGFIAIILLAPIIIGMTAYIYGRLVPGAAMNDDMEPSVAPAV